LKEKSNKTIHLGSKIIEIDETIEEQPKDSISKKVDVESLPPKKEEKTTMVGKDLLQNKLKSEVERLKQKAKAEQKQRKQEKLQVDEDLEEILFERTVTESHETKKK